MICTSSIVLQIWKIRTKILLLLEDWYTLLLYCPGVFWLDGPWYGVGSAHKRNKPFWPLICWYGGSSPEGFICSELWDFGSVCLRPIREASVVIILVGVSCTFFVAPSTSLENWGPFQAWTPAWKDYSCSGISQFSAKLEDRVWSCKGSLKCEGYYMAQKLQISPCCVLWTLLYCWDKTGHCGKSVLG